MTSGSFGNRESGSASAMSIRSLKERFKRLQRGPFRWLVALVATIHQSVIHRSPVLIFVDREGDWHNCRHDAIFIAPELNVSSYKAVRTATIDLWCHDCNLQNGDIVIDIGAGIGDDVLAFSRLVGAEGRVIAIEAHPRTFRCLVKTIAANRLENVIALNVAVSDQEGSVTISSEENFLSNSIVAGIGATTIRAARFDHIFSELKLARPKLIKMNIEGAETAALRGMDESLSTTPHIVVSCHDFKADRGEDQALRTYKDVNQILQNAGYALRSRGEDHRKEVRYYVYGGKGINPERNRSGPAK